MFKPNIRGYPRATLRLGRKGWRISGNSGDVFRYRLPWRRSWVHVLLTDLRAQPVLSRSGYVHVILKASTSTSGNSKQRRPYVVLFVSTILAMVAILLWPKQNAGMSNSKVPQESSNLNYVSACQQAMQEPKKFVASWSLGQTDLVRVQPKSEILLGGVKSNILTLTCDDQTAEYRASFALVKDVWELKYLVQLEN